MRTLSFVQVDVFTSRAFEGNQLAVVMDASGLDTEQMQALRGRRTLRDDVRDPALLRRDARQRPSREHFYGERGAAVRGTSDAGHGVGLASGIAARRESWLDLNVGRSSALHHDEAGQPSAR